MFDVQGGMPFDTLSVALCHSSARPAAAAGHEPTSTTDRAVHVAVAAWMAVVSECWDEAQELAQASLHIAREGQGDATGDALVVVCHGLVDIIALLRFGLPPNHSTLDRIAQVLTGKQASPVETFAPMLEIPNWFTFADRFQDAGRISDRQLLDARAAEDLPGIIWSLGCRADLDLRRGRWMQAAAALREGFNLSRLQQLPDGYLHVLSARLAAATGHTDRAISHVALARATAFDLGDASTKWRADAVEGFAKLSADDVGAAATILQRLWSDRSSNDQVLSSVRQWDADLVEVLVRQGRFTEATEVASRLDDARADVTPWQRAIQKRCAALVSAGIGRTATAAGLDAAMESAEIFVTIGAPFEQARSYLVVGELQDELGYCSDAAAHFEWAARTFAALGAVPWKRRARHGSRTHPRLAVPIAPAWDRLLTDQERAIADAVVSGLSNVEAASRLFVSTKTIETHLTHIYRKLGLTSRTQLAAYVHRSSIRSADRRVHVSGHVSADGAHHVSVPSGAGQDECAAQRGDDRCG
jgi:DNA-binding CsgD family transcriptional regulator